MTFRSITVAEESKWTNRSTIRFVTTWDHVRRNRRRWSHSSHAGYRVARQWPRPHFVEGVACPWTRPL